MKTNRLSLLMLCVLAEFAIAAEPVTLKLWADGPSTAIVAKSAATEKLIQSYGGVGPDRITDLSDLTITVFLPEKPNDTAVIVAPSGQHCEAFFFQSLLRFWPKGPFDCPAQAIGTGTVTNSSQKAQRAGSSSCGTACSNGRPFGPPGATALTRPGRLAVGRINGHAFGPETDQPMATTLCRMDAEPQLPRRKLSSNVLC